MDEKIKKGIGFGWDYKNSSMTVVLRKVIHLSAYPCQRTFGNPWRHF